MNNYIDLLRNILKNFDNNEFDDVIKKILSNLFDDYCMNRNIYIWCIDNLYKKFYVGRYDFIKKKYGIIKNENLIFRFNRYNKKTYIIKLLKDNVRVILDENEIYDSVSDIILQTRSIKNYKRYIDNMFINREIDRYMSNLKKVCNKVDNDNEVVKKDNNIFGIKTCLNYVSNNNNNNNYCHLHNKDMI